MQSSLYMAALLLLLLFVNLRGAYPERAIIWMIFVADLADLFYHRIYGPSDFRTVETFHIVADTMTFSAVLWVALGANRLWPLPVCALHLLGLTAHLAKMTGMPSFNQVYWAMTSIPDYLQLPIILVGTLAHSRRFERIGPYRDWRHDWSVPAFLRQPATSGVNG
jgi:hypothetical protein